MRRITAATLREALAREIHHDRPHDAGRVAEKMRPVAHVEFADLQEPQVTLIHERTGLEQSDLGGPPQTLVRELTEFLVGEGNDLVDGAGLAAARGLQ
jgi:hypothetical protein